MESLTQTNHTSSTNKKITQALTHAGGFSAPLLLQLWSVKYRENSDRKIDRKQTKKSISEIDLLKNGKVALKKMLIFCLHNVKGDFQGFFSLNFR